MQANIDTIACSIKTQREYAHYIMSKYIIHLVILRILEFYSHTHKICLLIVTILLKPVIIN